LLQQSLVQRMTNRSIEKILCILLGMLGSISAIQSQPANDNCENATVIPNVMSDAPFVCIQSTNLNALPENFNNPCEIGSQPTVWFEVTTDGNATLMNIHVTSAQIMAPTISLFQSVQGCSNLQPVGMTQTNLPCYMGSNGEAEALSTSVGSNQTYYIAIGSLNSNGGAFEICVNTISVSSACVTSRDIEIVARSEGGSLAGPFLPGETVSVCFNVNSFTAASNGCQWFQGIVPIFGNGWDPSSFDGNGQPLEATINGLPIGESGNGLYGTATWDWFTDVGYHHNNPFLQVGDLDGNGTVDMCHLLYSSDCPDFGGLTGGCCGPCWDNPGDILPPGWFAYGINGTCATPGPPVSVDWGDGNSCGGGMGPWSFCFELTVRDFPDCSEDPTTSDLTLGFFTMADGETGSWGGGASVCALDQPAQITFPMCCGEAGSEDEILPDLCGQGIVEIVLEQPGIEFWTWTADAINVTGFSEGEGVSGTLVIDTLLNTGNGPGTVYYFFEGTGTGGCFTFEYSVTVDVFAPLDIELILPHTCDAFPTDYVITSSVSGGSGDYEYLWIPGQITTPDITIQNPVEGQVYTVIVTDNTGCIDTAAISIAFDSTLNVSITSPGSTSCDAPVPLTGNASGGEAPYTYQWTLPGGSTMSGQSIQADISGIYQLTAIDISGCAGVDSIAVTIFDSPSVSIALSDADSTICAGETVTLTGEANSGQPPFLFIWSTPMSIDTAQTINSGSAGDHTLVVIDNNGCSDTVLVTLVVNESPSIDSSLSSQEICFGDSASFTVVFNGGQPPFDIVWSTPVGEDTLQTIVVSEAGDYSVLVTDSLGCADSVEVNLQVNELPYLGPDTSQVTICAGDSVYLDAMVTGGEAPFDFMWTTPGGVDTSQSILIGAGGDYHLAVVDINGCADSALFTVAVLDLPNVDLGEDTIHTTVDVVLDAGPGFASYLWSTGNSTQTITAGMTGWLFVTVTDDFGCSDVDSMFIDFITALADPYANTSISVKPNPSTGIFTVEGNATGPQLCHIDVFNSLGQLRYTWKHQKVDGQFSHQVNMRYDVADVYFVRIRLGEKVFQEKVVIY
jgi:hypothetical protein